MDLSERVASVLSDLLSEQFNAKITIILGGEKVSEPNAKTDASGSASESENNIKGSYHFSAKGDLLDIPCDEGSVAVCKPSRTKSKRATPEPIPTSVRMFCEDVKYCGEVKCETVYNDYCNYCETTGWRPMVICEKFFPNFHAVMRERIIT